MRLIPLLFCLSGLGLQFAFAATTQRCSSIASSATASGSSSATASFTGSATGTRSSSAASATSTHHSSSGNNSGDDDDDDKSDPDSGDNARRSLDFVQCVETVVESGRSGLSKGAVAGIVIGFLALAAASALLGFAYWRKRRAARRQANPLGPVDSPKTKFLSALALPRTHARETSSPSPHAWAPLLGGSARRQNRAAEDAEAEAASPIGDSEFFSIPVFDRELPPTPSGMSNLSTAPGASTSAALASGLGLSTGGGSTTTRHSSLHNEMAAYQRDLKGEMRSNGSIGHSSLGHSASTSTTRASGSGGTTGLQAEMAAYQRDLKTAGGVQTGLSTTPSLSNAPSASNAAVAIASGSGSGSGSGGGSHSRRSSLQSELTEHQVNMKAEARAKEGEEGAVEPPPEYSFD